MKIHARHGYFKAWPPSKGEDYQWYQKYGRLYSLCWTADVKTTEKPEEITCLKCLEKLSKLQSK